MTPFHTRLLGAAVALTRRDRRAALAQQLELKIMASAAPGGGWDETARAMQPALTAAGIAQEAFRSPTCPARAAPSASRSSSTAPRAMATS